MNIKDTGDHIGSGQAEHEPGPGAHHRGQARIVLYIDGDAPQQDLEHTFLHELFHALFEAAGRDELSSDESLVDTMGALLHQFMQTAKGNLQDDD